MPHKPLNYAIFILHIFQSSHLLFRMGSFMSDVFYDDEQHRNEEYTEDSCNGGTKDDSNAHRNTV